MSLVGRVDHVGRELRILVMLHEVLLLISVGIRLGKHCKLLVWVRPLLQGIDSFSCVRIGRSVVGHLIGLRLSLLLLVVEYDIRQRGMLFGNVLAANVNVSVGYRVRKSRSVLMVPNNSCLVAACQGSLASVQQFQ